MNIASEMQERLTAEVRDNQVVLYMKGTANFPMCGFSARAARVLQSAGVKFKDVNILEDDDLRVALKAFSDWPTFPQCYIKGEFIGGSDILLEMYETGELEKKLDGVTKA
jgi:monothiol glutaredoxin